MGAPLDSYPVPSRRPPVCLLLAAAGSLEADKQHLSGLLLISCSLQMLSLTAVVAGRRSVATLQPQLQQITAGEGGGRFLPDGLLWLDGDRQGDALRLAVRGA